MNDHPSPRIEPRATADPGPPCPPQLSTEITIVLLATTTARFGVTVAHWIADADPPGPGMTLAVAGPTRPHPVEPADRVVFVVPEHQHAPACSLFTAPPATDTGSEPRAALVSYGGLRRGIHGDERTIDPKVGSAGE